MKTVCPNCHQKYDVPSESIHNEIKCEKCHENFVVEPAKLCTECGTSNSKEDGICFRCGEKLESGTRTEETSTRETPPSYSAAVPPMEKKPLEVDLVEGFAMAFVMVVILVLLIICWTRILNPRSSSDVLIAATLFGIITSIAYLGIWLVYLIAALRRNEIGKIILLTILPGIGIIICAFFPPKSWSTPAYSKGVQIR